MKLNKIKLTIAAFAAIALASCSEGQYWEGSSDPGQAYAFPKPAETVSIPADATVPSTYEVSVTRNTAAGDVTVPVEFTSTSPLLTGANSVSFAAGQYETKYVINIAPGVKAGLTYSATLKLALPESTIVKVDASNLSFTLNLSQVLVLNWVSKGDANTYSGWAGNEEPIAIPVEEATNWPIDGQRLMRLVSPYYYLEPAVAEEGYNIQFYLDADGNAAGMYSEYQYIGESDSEYGYFFFGCPASYGMYFANEGNVYAMVGIMGYASSPTAAAGSVSAGWYETLQFQWSE